MIAPPSPSKGPLSGLRVIELGVLLAGPFCGQLLGDFGAEVIKLEPPGKPDPLRQWGHIKPEGRSLWWPIVGRNKRCATLNLREEEGQNILKELVSSADIVLENFRPGTMEKWGLGYDTLSAINEKLIMVRVSGYGQTGPMSHKAGYAAVGEAMGGLRYVMGEPDRRPSRAGISIGDSLAATFGCLGALAALHHRNATGKGQVVDSAIFEACFAMMESLVPEYQFAEYIRERSGSKLTGVAPSNIYNAKDGMLIIAANQDTVFTRLADAMGQPELAANERYATHNARGDNQEELDDLIDAWAGTKTVDEIIALCDEHGVPTGRIYRAPEMIDDPHFHARESIKTVKHPVLGDFMMQNVFPKLSATPGDVNWTGPDYAEHNDYLYKDVLGYSDDKIAGLKEKGVI